jgi:predicted phosphohydrolase
VFATQTFTTHKESYLNLPQLLNKYNPGPMSSLLNEQQNQTTMTATPSPPPITLVCLSDIHSLSLPAIPDGDVIILAGDLSEGMPLQLSSRLRELSGLTTRFQHILVIGGNHDRALDAACDARDVLHYSDKEYRNACRLGFRSTPGITYLENSGAVISVRGREFTVWGSPGSPATSKQTAFGYLEEEAADVWARIPRDVDVLVTHTPPLGYLDAGMGCVELTKALWKIKPGVHVFGHVHSGHGSAIIRYDRIQREYEEELARTRKVELTASAAGKGRYVPPHLRTKEVRVPVVMPAEMSMIPKEPLVKGEATVLVNAAFMGGSEGERGPIRVLV